MKYNKFRIFEGRYGQIIVLLFLFLVAGIPRLMYISAGSLNSDEIQWMRRGNILVNNINKHEWVKATNRLKAPGVTTAAMIGYSRRYLTGFFDPITSSRLPIGLISTFSLLLMYLLCKKRIDWKIAFLASFFLALDFHHISLSRVAHTDNMLMFWVIFVVLGYFNAEKYMEEKGRIGFSWWWSSIAMGLAFLSKLTAFLIPCALITYKYTKHIVYRWDRHQTQPLKKSILLDTAWLTVAFIVYMVLYPKLWQSPFTSGWYVYNIDSPALKTIYSILDSITFDNSIWLLMVILILTGLILINYLTPWKKNRDLNEKGLNRLITIFIVICFIVVFLNIFRLPIENIILQLRTASNIGTITVHKTFWKGTMVDELPPWYYIYALIVTLPELILIPLFIGLVISFIRFRSDFVNGHVWPLFLIVISVYLLLMSLSEQKALRYLSPIYPFIYLITIRGGMEIWRLISNTKLRQVKEITIALIIILPILCYIPRFMTYKPNFGLFHNLLIGGLKGAAKVKNVLWGEGHHEAAEYLRHAVKDYNAIYTNGYSGVLYYYLHHYFHLPLLINVVRYPDIDFFVDIGVKKERKKHGIRDAIIHLEPDHRIVLNGLEVARIYRMNPVLHSESIIYRAVKLRIRNGRRGKDNKWDGRKAVYSIRRGHLTTGPYHFFKSGKYKAIFSVRVSDKYDKKTRIILDVAANIGQDVLATRIIDYKQFKSKEPGYHEWSVPFEVKDNSRLEFRCALQGEGILWFDQVMIEPFNN